MKDTFEDLLREWDGEQLVVRYDSPSSTWMFLSIHSTRLGPATGGTRLRVYPGPAAGLADGQRLARAMTIKMALAGVQLGGGKAVLAVPALPDDSARAEIIDRYAELVASLGGTYLTAPDMNTSESDMDRIGRRCPFVFCRSVAHGGSGSSAPATALGVLHGIRASVGHALDMSDLAGVTVLVQGLGGVGGHLVQLLAEAGAKLLVADIDAARVNRAVRDLGATMVEPDAVIDADCDVFAPCAVGGVLDLPAAEALKSRVVAGAANNQLTDPQVARRLRDRRVLYAPDFVINAGGVLHGVGLERLGWSAEDLQHHLAGIGERLLAIYREADAAGVSTHDAAERAAVRRLDAGPGVRRYVDLHTGSRGVGMGSGDAGR